MDEEKSGKRKKNTATASCRAGRVCSAAGTRYCHICDFNPDKRAVKIKSASASDFTSDIVMDGVRIQVLTQKSGPGKPIIVTTAFKGGEIISTRKADYGHLAGDPDMNAKVLDLMWKQHLAVQNALKEKNACRRKIAADYLNDVTGLLKKGNQNAALTTLHSALVEHPFNPFLLSYYGCLEAIVNRNFDRGVDICRDAIAILNEEILVGPEVFYPVFYLNLGRACLAAGNKKEAAESFKTGLEADPEDPELLLEIKRMGKRRRPALTFLKRTNPLNKYIGILLYRLHSA